MNKHKKNVLRGLLSSVIALGFAPALLAQSANVNSVEKHTTVITACGKLFEIDANAAGLTASERAAIIQKNLDNALIAGKDRTSHSVDVRVVNRNPVVVLDNYYVATADGNSAARRQMSQMDLAKDWAASIKLCLADSLKIQNYVSMLTGQFKEEKKMTAMRTRPDVAVAPWGTLLPVKLLTPFSSVGSLSGQPIEAVLSTDVPLGPSFSTYLPAGTRAKGQLVSASPFTPNNHAGRSAITVQFDRLTTPDGKDIPINGHILGSVNQWRTVTVEPVKAVCCLNEKASTAKAIIESPFLHEHGRLVAVEPAKGEIGGAWKGLPTDNLTKSNNMDASNFRRLILSREFPIRAEVGEQMMLELASTTTIAVGNGTGTM